MEVRQALWTYRSLFPQLQTGSMLSSILPQPLFLQCLCKTVVMDPFEFTLYREATEPIWEWILGPQLQPMPILEQLIGGVLSLPTYIFHMLNLNAVMGIRG